MAMTQDPTTLTSTMMDCPIGIQALYRRGRDLCADSEVVTWEGDGARRATFGEVAANVERLAAALARLGIGPGEVVGTLMWNQHEHQEAYLAIPCMGAVLHTLNLRLAPDQLAWIVNHAGDKAIIVDDSLVPALAAIRDRLTTVRHIIVTGSGDASALGDVLRYRDLVAGEAPGFAWPAIDERAPASICYTTGTTGDPKGVAYSHRSVFLHSLGVWGGFGLTEADRLLMVVPQFHVNAWGMPYVAWMLGADLLMPARHLQGEALARFIESERPTRLVGIPTVWDGLLRHIDANPTDVSSVKQVICGGAPVPRSLIEGMDRHGMRVLQAWGMTETSPVVGIANPPRGTLPEDEMPWRLKTGRTMPGVELRIVDEEGRVLPSDGATVGDIEVRGPWITGSYLHAPSPEKFHEGWLRTGDVGHLDARGYLQITDRSKDVIKSGGEWISSVELETTLVGHPGVREAAVIAVPDELWTERPLAVVVLEDGAETQPQDLVAFLTGKVAKFWIPERWTVVSEIPKTSVGKIDKKAIRARYAAGDLQVKA